MGITTSSSEPLFPIALRLKKHNVLYAKLVKNYDTHYIMLLPSSRVVVWMSVECFSAGKPHSEQGNRT